MRILKISRKVLVIAAIILISKGASAQLQITSGSQLTNWTPDSLVRNVLLGEGVEVFNVQFNGSFSSINCTGVGKFTTGTTTTNLGMSEGLILSASSMEYITNASSTASTSTCTSVSDANLAALVSPYAINNAAVLEFDFKPRSDSIKFRYVFASEEYYGFECTQYNDIFAFFLSGLSPFGGMYNNKNIALVPNTETPITINTVNGGQNYGTVTPCITTNTQYFVNNSSMTHIKHMDGFTTVLTAEAKVVPCQTYHLKMAVANVSDQALPSCVFLEANSLTSNAIEFTFENTANPQHPDELYEGCVAYLHMHRPTPSSTPTRIDLEIEGEVSNGIDFPYMQDYFMFPADTTDMTILISPFNDGLDEGVMIPGREYAKLVLSPANGCPRSDSVEFWVIDTHPIGVEIEYDTIMNTSASVMLNAIVTGGMPNREVRWKRMTYNPVTQSYVGDYFATGETINYSLTPNNDRYVVAEVEDACNNVAYDTVFLGVRRNFAFQPHDTTICEGSPLSLTVTGADSCVWSRNGQVFEYSSPTVGVTPMQTSVHVIKSYIWWNGQIWEDIDSMRVIVIPAPDVRVTASSNRICEGQPVTLSASGTSNFSFDGGVTFSTNNSHTFYPDTTTLFIVFGKTTTAECSGRDSIVITVDTIPDMVISAPGGVCGGEDVMLTLATTAESFMWFASPSDPTLTGQETHVTVIVNPQVTTVYTVNGTNGVCSNSTSTTVAVEAPPVAIGEVNPRTVSLGKMEAVFTDISLNTTSRRWDLPDGTTRTEKEISYIVPDDVDSINVLLWAYNPYMCFDTTTVTVYVDHTTLWTPNAFTPDESTNNTFLVKMNDVQRYHIMIYDRGGQLVFESYDPEQPWDGKSLNGKNCPQGAYVYIISCHKIAYPYDQIIKRGTVLLLR
ncbi:MAG: choice-of-anchor L domain-containing protein [Bacteroidales bacterium]|nr:choice-of-anchor L domain-containing protein [Bacteroidales bacterium]